MKRLTAQVRYQYRNIKPDTTLHKTAGVKIIVLKHPTKHKKEWINPNTVSTYRAQAMTY